MLHYQQQILLKFIKLLKYQCMELRIKESCTTPSGQTGECLPLKSCSPLLWAFTNYKPGLEKHLMKYLCPGYNLTLVVCCTTGQSLMFENDEYDVFEGLVKPIRLINPENCGTPSDIKINNEVLRVQDFPWLVKIVVVNYTDTKDYRLHKVRCTGILINNWYVLFSAQCLRTLYGSSRQIFIRIESFTNKHENCSADSYSPNCNNYEIFGFDSGLPHYFFDEQTKLNDIAILKLHRRAEYSESVRPICLPTPSQILPVGQTLHVAGWNKTNSANDVSVKLIHSVNYISNQDCQTILDTNGSNVTLTIYEMCTTNKDSSNIADDLGFPLMVLQDNRWYFQGFVSDGQITKRYTRAQNYLQWVQEEMGGELCYMPYDNNTIIGECMHITHCPKLLGAFANASPKDTRTLSEFRCWYGNEDPNNPLYPQKVCCNLTSNFTILVETQNDLDYEVSDYRFCGLQHRDDYFSTDDNISFDEFPWLAVILNSEVPERNNTVCAGTLITRRYVISSAQCMATFHSNDTMVVRLGDYDLKNSTDCKEFAEIGAIDCNDLQEYGIEKKIIHPFYNRYTFLHDIALLRLNATVFFTQYVRPICLPRSENDLAQLGDTLFTTGFGSNDRDSEGLTIKKKIRTTLISNQECDDKLKRMNLLNVITPLQMCTSDIANFTNTICVGDEGGPIMHSKKSRWFIDGVSFSFSCGEDKPHTFLKIYKYLNWIKLRVRD